MSQPVMESNVAAVLPRDLDTQLQPASNQALRVRSFGLTDRGKVRTSNQDQFLIAVLTKQLQVQ